MDDFWPAEQVATALAAEIDDGETHDDDASSFVVDGDNVEIYASADVDESAPILVTTLVDPDKRTRTQTYRWRLVTDDSDH